MFSFRSVLPALLLVQTLGLAAQGPHERIQLGFKALPTGNWDYALREWTRDGTWVDVDGKLKGKLEGWIPGPRTFGHWEPMTLAHRTPVWQRHWVTASFDQGVVYFSFDFVLHKTQWRLASLQAAQDPTEILPHLDLLPAILAIKDR
jgi:hypothetical protein